LRWVIGLVVNDLKQSVTYDLGNKLDVTPFTPTHHIQYILYKVIFLTYMEHEILLPRATNIPHVVMETSAFDYPA
jgi:hypothetical protein